MLTSAFVQLVDKCLCPPDSWQFIFALFSILTTIFVWIELRSCPWQMDRQTDRQIDRQTDRRMQKKVRFNTERFRCDNMIWTWRIYICGIAWLCSFEKRNDVQTDRSINEWTDKMILVWTWAYRWTDKSPDERTHEIRLMKGQMRFDWCRDTWDSTDG